jgi:hypothetical protein
VKKHLLFKCKFCAEMMLERYGLPLKTWVNRFFLAQIKKFSALEISVDCRRFW